MLTRQLIAQRADKRSQCGGARWLNREFRVEERESHRGAQLIIIDPNQAVDVTTCAFGFGTWCVAKTLVA